MPHDNHINRIVNGLQKIRAEQRRGKREELHRYAPLREIVNQSFIPAHISLLLNIS